MMLKTYAKLMSDYNGHIVLDVEDTDVYTQAAYVSKQERGKLYILRKKQLVDCEVMLSEEMAYIIIAVHVISGLDHTSNFYNHGKTSVMKSIENDAATRKLLSVVEMEPELSNDIETVYFK